MAGGVRRWLSHNLLGHGHCRPYECEVGALLCNIADHANRMEDLARRVAEHRAAYPSAYDGSGTA